jgi:cytochrome c553
MRPDPREHPLVTPGTETSVARAYVMDMFRRTIALLCAAALMPLAAAAQPAAKPKARAIPGITAKDAFPAACVGCHIKTPAVDARLSVMLTKTKKKHPKVAMTNVPASCAKCHSATSKVIPPLAKMVHRIHLGNDQGEFLAKFQGECTHCHKLDRKTGAWSIPNGAEK